MNKILTIFALCVCIVVAGCSKGPKKPKDLPKLNPTTITVLYDDGTPVEGATVVLRLAQSTGGRTWNVVGQSDATGKAVLKTDANWEGVPAGEYEGMVTKEVADVEKAKELGGSDVVKSITRFVAVKYSNPHDSGLKASVTDGGENAFEFKVGEKIEENVDVM